MCFAYRLQSVIKHAHDHLSSNALSLFSLEGGLEMVAGFCPGTTELALTEEELCVLSAATGKRERAQTGRPCPALHSRSTVSLQKELPV